VVGETVVGEDVGPAVRETEVGDEELGDLVAVGEDVIRFLLPDLIIKL
jgi:hypothetical protein